MGIGITAALIGARVAAKKVAKSVIKKAVTVSGRAGVSAIKGSRKVAKAAKVAYGKAGRRVVSGAKKAGSQAKSSAKKVYGRTKNYLSSQKKSDKISKAIGGGALGVAAGVGVDRAITGPYTSSGRKKRKKSDY